MARNHKSENQNSRKPISSRARNRRLAQRANKNSLHGFEALEDRRMLATLTVGNSLDVIDGDTSSITNLIATPGADGISLREAIRASNNTTGADTLMFDPAVFTGGADSLIRLTNGELRITDSLTIDASAAIDVTITGDANGDDVTDAMNITDVGESRGLSGFVSDLLDDNSRVLNFSNFEGDLTLSGLTITGGVDSGFTFEDGGGGLHFGSSGLLTLTDSMVSGNFSDEMGGGIYSRSSATTLTNSTVSGNSTSGFGAEGGGIYLRDGSLTLMNSTVSNNYTSRESSNGGGIYVNSGSLTAFDSTVTGNYTAGDDSTGGGISSLNSQVTLVNSDATGNFTLGSEASGGAIYTRGGNLFLDGSSVSENSTAGDNASGGGLSTFSASLTLSNSTVADNSTLGYRAAGGGVHASPYSVGRFNTTIVTNSTISGNSTAGDGASGGGIGSPGLLTLTNSFVIGNHTSGGGDGYAANGGGIAARELTLNV